MLNGIEHYNKCQQQHKGCRKQPSEHRRRSAAAAIGATRGAACQRMLRQLVWRHATAQAVEYVATLVGEPKRIMEAARAAIAEIHSQTVLFIQ